MNLFPPLADVTLHRSCFFDAKEHGLLKVPVAVVVGNPPFESTLTTDGAKRSYDAYTKAYGLLADTQLAYLFFHEAMELLRPDGILALIEPAGFLYNQNAASFRRGIFARWSVREILDFVSVRGLFKKVKADPKIVVVLAEATKPVADGWVLHGVFRRNGRATAEQGFDIDYYDLHWFDPMMPKNLLTYGDQTYSAGAECVISSIVFGNIRRSETSRHARTGTLVKVTLPG